MLYRPLPDEMMDGLITTRAAAKLLGVSERRVRQFVKDGRLWYYQPGGQHTPFLFRKEHVMAFLSKPRFAGRPKVNFDDDD